MSLKRIKDACPEETGFSYTMSIILVSKKAHLEMTLDLPKEVCYTGNSNPAYPSGKTRSLMGYTDHPDDVSGP